MPELALFDFDGTITSKDSFRQFVRYAHTPARFRQLLLLTAPTVFLLGTGMMPVQKAKERIFYQCFRNCQEAALWEKGRLFAQETLPTLIRPKASERIQYHQQEGHTLYIVSASLDIWLRPWCEHNSMGLICTEVQFEQGRLVQAFRTPNCKGEEKVRRIRELIDLEQYDTIHAYGDTSGDHAMLGLASEGCAHYRVF